MHKRAKNSPVFSMLVNQHFPYYSARAIILLEWQRACTCMFAHTILLSSLLGGVEGGGGKGRKGGGRREPLFPSDRVFAEQKLENANLIEKTKRAKRARKEWWVWMDGCRRERDLMSREANFWDIDFHATDPWIVLPDGLKLQR